MRKTLVLSAATAALLLFAPSALAQEADQPGDSSTQARLSGSADGELSPAGDLDWYRLSVESGQRYTLRLEGVAGEDGQAVDPMLGVYDAQGNQLAFNDDDGETLNALLRYAPQTSGEVFVEARAFSGEATGRYRLSVTSEAVPPDDAGNDASTRARIRPNNPVSGTIESEGDVDWYRMSARTGQTYRISLAGGEGGLGDPVLRVLDREGAELAANDDTDGSLNSLVEFTPQASGDVFIEARGYGDAYTGGYTLSVVSARGQTDGVAASTATRGRVTVGETEAGVLDFAGDTDWYRVRLEEGQSYRFTLNSAGEAPVSDPLLRLRGSDGEEIVIDDDGGDGFNSYLEYTATRTGNYFLEAAGFTGDATGGYEIGARAGDIPADASTDANLSADGDYRDGVLSPAGDSDWYRLDLSEGQGVRIGASGGEGADMLGDPYIVIHSASGDELAHDDDGGEGLSAWLEYTAPAAGAYYVEVRGFTEDASGRYSLAVTAGEIGGSAEAPEYLTASGEGRTARIGANDDVDWFAIELIEGRPYRFYLDGAGDTPLEDPYLVLYDAQGNQVAADDDGGAGLNSYLSFVSPAGGSYFAAASSFGGTGSGQYALRAIDTDVPGHVNTDEALDSASDERLSRIEWAEDADAYRVELDAGAAYLIEVTGEGDSRLADPFVAILDMQGQRVSYDDDSGDGRNARLRFTPEEAGTYFIQASGLGGSTGGYQVHIVRQ